MGTPHSTATIIKSPADQRDYQVFALGNQLRCCVVHDPHASHAAASVAVNAGHFHDPDHAQGLAHFLEHMLFLGTEAYPDAEDYQRFISNHGGNHNAWTGTEFSNYYFHINPDFFAEALDRFVRFFYQPKFAPEWIAKELQSIESEFQLKRRDELRRLHQVHKATVNQQHPFAKFSVGNQDTLRDTNERPLARELRQFFDSYYQPQRMTLVLVGPQPLAELKRLAQQYGGQLPHVNAPYVAAELPALYTPNQLGLMISVKPIKDARRLILSFALPSIDQDYPYKTTSFIAHLLGYEGPGSLFARLREQHLILSLAAGGGMSGSNFKDFNINMQLTETGLNQVDEIITEVLAYIRLIEQSGIEQWRYEERQRTVEQSFRYQEAVSSQDLAPQLAINLQHYGAEDVVFGDYRMDALNQSFAKQLLALMSPKNMRVTLIHKAVETTEVEPFYDTEYAVTELTAAQINQFNAASAAACQAQLPAANPYLKLIRDVHPLTDSAKDHGQNNSQTITPKYYALAPQVECWHLQDPDFRVPKAHVYLSLCLPAVTASARHFAIARTWCELLLDELSESCYDAEVAGLHFNIYPQQQGVTLHLSGSSGGLVELAHVILKTMTHAQFSPSRFEALRNKLKHNWRASMANRPLNILFAQLNVMLQPNTFSVCQLADELEQIDFADYQQWRQAAFDQVHCEILACGDILLSEFKPILDQLIQRFPISNHSLKSSLEPRRVQQLDATQQAQICSDIRAVHSDTAVILAIQGEQPSLFEQACFLLLNQLISGRFFHQMRTEQQLGYLVGTSYLPIQELPHLILYIQSTKYSATHIQAAIHDFLQQFLSDISNDIERQLSHAKQAIRRQLLEPDTNLRNRTQRLWSSITQNDHQFNRLDLLADAIQAMTSEQLLASFTQLLSHQECQLWLDNELNHFDSDLGIG